MISETGRQGKHKVMEWPREGMRSIHGRSLALCWLTVGATGWCVTSEGTDAFGPADNEVQTNDRIDGLWLSHDEDNVVEGYEKIEFQKSQTKNHPAPSDFCEI